MIVDPDFCDHWKTRMLVGLLDNDEAAPVYVIRLWAHCQNRRQASFENLPPEALKALCRFPGHSNKLDASLTASGFIRRDGNELIVCNWADYNSALIAAWKNGSKGGRPSKVASRNPRVDTSKPTGYPTGSRVEKSREELLGGGDARDDEPPLPFPAKRLDPINFDPWLQAFLPLWDATPGVAKQDGCISELERRLLEARLSDPWWVKNWRKALEMFPLPYFKSQGNLVGLMTFLDDGFVQKVVQNKYHNNWSKTATKRESKVDEIVDVISQVQELEERRNTAFQTSATGRLT